MSTTANLPPTLVELTAADLDRLGGLGVPIELALSELDFELQLVLDLDWRDISIGLHAENDGRAKNHGVVESALRNLGL